MVGKESFEISKMWNVKDDDRIEWTETILSVEQNGNSRYSNSMNKSYLVRLWWRPRRRQTQDEKKYSHESI